MYAATAATTTAAAVSAACDTDDVEVCVGESQPLLSPLACLVAKLCVSDWAQAIQCALPHVEPEPCQRQGCGILVHHLCQESRRSSRKESMETGRGGDDVGGVRYYYYHSEESIKNLPGYPDGASRAAGKRLFPGRPGSKFWTAGKILSDFFRSQLFLAHFFSIQANIITILEAKQPGRQSEGNFNLGFSMKTYPAHRSFVLRQATSSVCGSLMINLLKLIQKIL